MPEPTALEQQFRQLQQTGQLEGLLFVIREEMALSERDLRAHLLGTALVDIPSVAETHMLQGRMKACATLIEKIRTLAGIGQAPKE